MLTIAIIGCVVFLGVLISSYWWGFHSRFSLGSRLVDAKESTPAEGGKDTAHSSDGVLEFDYVFERNRNKVAQVNAQSSSTVSNGLINNQESNQGDRPTGKDQLNRSSAKPLQPVEVDTFGTPASASASASTTKTTVVSLQAHRESKQNAQSVAANAVTASSSANSQNSSLESDDLKEIWGIGVVFENLLNSKGVNTFEQLANISDEVKEDVRASLGIYSNRIERDEWVSQATALFDSKSSAQRVV